MHNLNTNQPLQQSNLIHKFIGNLIHKLIGKAIKGKHNLPWKGGWPWAPFCTVLGVEVAVVVSETTPAGFILDCPPCPLLPDFLKLDKSVKN